MRGGRFGVGVSSRGRDALLVTLVALASSLATLFLVWPAQQLVLTTPDPYNYAAIARRMLVEGFGSQGLTKREASLYPVLIAWIYGLAGEQPLIVTLLQCVMFAATALLVFDLGRRLYTRRTAVIGGLLFALNPLPLRYVADLHMETMVTFLLTLSVWTTVRFAGRPTVARGLAAGAAAGVAALTKGVAIVPALVFGVWWTGKVVTSHLRRDRPAMPWRPVAAIALATAIVIAPWAARNFRVTGGRFVPLAPGLSDAFLRGYVFSRAEFALLRQPPYIDAENECNRWFAEICRRAGTEFGRDEVRDEQILGAVALDMIANEPLELVRKTTVGLFTFWYQMTTPFNSLVSGLLAAAAWLLAFAGFGRARREGRHTSLLLVPILSMNAVIALLCSLGRYSIPILPCLMVLAAFGVDTLRGAGRSSTETPPYTPRAS